MHLELIILGLLVAVAGLGALARPLGVPYPILLVVGGLAIGFVPEVDDIQLPPDLVLLIFLPPLLYAAAFFNNPRELLRNRRAIGLLAIALVLATMVSVATVAHFVVGLSWPVAFVLGAIVSPTDAVAPGVIVRRLGVPRRLVTLLEGESLTNDWAALTFYKFAVAAVVTGSFSLLEAGPRFLLSGVGGVAVGLAVGYVLRRVRRRLDDVQVESTISLFAGYAAYLPAEELGLSGVIAAVTIGLYMGWYTSELTTPTTRIQITAIWGLLEFLLNAVLFVLIGLQLGQVIDQLGDEALSELLLWSVSVAGTVIVTRIVWVFLTSWAGRTFSRSIRETEPLTWRAMTILSWSGMRGAVALAAALAIPRTIEGGAPFPDRDLLIFLTYAVILATLVFQGLTLPALIRRLGVEDDGLDQLEELAARRRAAEAAVERLDQLQPEEWVRDETVDRLRGLMEFRQRRFADPVDGEETIEEQERSGRYQRLMHEVIGAERDALVALRNEGAITDSVMRRVLKDLDLEEARLDQ